jgi:hypothetical protein
MEVTAITYTNGKKEIQYGIQHLARTRDVSEYTYLNLSEEQLKRIRRAKAEEVQKILSQLF